MRKSSTAIKPVKVVCELFQAKRSFFRTSNDYFDQNDIEKLREGFSKGEYDHVFTFERSPAPLAGELEHIYFKSQNFEKSWRGRGRKGCRSTSVGDVVRVGKEYWIVAPTGFHLGWTDE